MAESLQQEVVLRLKQYIDQAEIITFYGGAGTSTESGIPDYRSRFGLWTTMEKSGQSPAKIANPSFSVKILKSSLKREKEVKKKSQNRILYIKFSLKWRRMGR